MNDLIIQLTKTIQSIKNSINRLPLRRGFLLIPLALVCFALSPTARAVSPPPDGGYPGGNTAEGEDALLSLTVGIGKNNTAIGAHALKNNTTGSINTAIGAYALRSNTVGRGNTATGYQALFKNRHGIGNTANGYNALFDNTRGSDNTGHRGWSADF